MSKAASVAASFSQACNVAYWHKTDMPTALRNVRYQGQSGSHMLALSFSGFDPIETLAAPSGIAFDAGFNPYQRARLNR